VQVLVISNRSLFGSLFLGQGAQHSGLTVTCVPLAVEVMDESSDQIGTVALAIVDISPDPETAIQVCAALRLRRPELPVVAAMCCPQTVTPDQLEALLQLGVRGLLDSSPTVEDVIQALRHAARGGKVMYLQPNGHSDWSTAAHLESLWLRPNSGLAEPFTELDRRIMSLVADGHSDREIGQAVHLSRHTVGHHVERLCQHVSVRNRTALAAWAGRHGYYRSSA
jgi:DNA-binding NarL/FixJ family response regulator